jgi:hypothetical protein
MEKSKYYEVPYKILGREFIFGIEHHIIGSDKRHHIRVTSKDPMAFLQYMGRDKQKLEQYLKRILTDETAELYPSANLNEIRFTQFYNTLVRIVGIFTLGDS